MGSGVRGRGRRQVSVQLVAWGGVGLELGVRMGLGVRGRGRRQVRVQLVAWGGARLAPPAGYHPPALAATAAATATVTAPTTLTLAAAKGWYPATPAAAKG